MKGCSTQKQAHEEEASPSSSSACSLFPVLCRQSGQAGGYFVSGRNLTQLKGAEIILHHLLRRAGSLSQLILLHHDLTMLEMIKLKHVAHLAHGAGVV